MSRVFIIDDDQIHQRIAQIMIEKHLIFDQYTSFTEADKALEFLKLNAEDDSAMPDVILLDLNMPVFDGWDFLDNFGIVAPCLHKPLRIYIVTSSVDEKDRIRSQTYPYVNGFISKPLSPDIIRSTRNEFIS
ncbi:response regulator [Hufsiella ginkgonis]|uniref:Response regulator n=1 Tax=Hufsiella ginkgonis TaxID=2695274 RepID=A0A7K1XUZ0_9SPHI|nr:response regulator [Hufsiella ginkgonis]MXV14617.1 response regulator [Hufsiella ginkgonis]